MRSVHAVLTCCLLLALPLGLTACGGDDRPYDAVPATTPELVPPDDANDLASGAPRSTSTTPSGTTGAQGTTPSTSSGGGTTPAPSTGGAAPAPSTGGTTPAPNTGGGTAPSTGGGTAPDTGGVSPDDTAAAGSVQQFCADNPGAC